MPASGKKRNRMHRVSAFLLLLGMASHPASAREDKNTVPSILRSATVYRNGAQLVHTATATLPQGSSELIIGDISNNIDISSIHVSCTNEVAVMSVTFATEYLKPESASPVEKRLQDSIEGIKKEQARIDVMIQSDSELLDILSANKKIAGNNGLTLAELTKMVDYYKQKNIEVRQELNGYYEKTDKLDKLIEKLEAQIKEEEKKNTRTGGRLVLQVTSPLAGQANFTVTYITKAATWSPFYDLKADNGRDSLHIVYRARLMQTTGIDWKKVKLSLSTSQPDLSGNAPLLKTWFLQFVDPQAFIRGVSTLSAPSNAVSGDFKKSQALNEVVVVGYGTTRKSETEATEPLYIVNGRVVEASEYRKIEPRFIKTKEVLTDDKAAAIYGSRGAAGVTLVTLKDIPNDYVSVSDNLMDVSFDLDIPYDVPTDGKNQGVVLREFSVPCYYQYYSAPRLDREAYLLGSITGWEKLNLLPGEANLIVEGSNIGKSFIDPAAIQDTLNLTMGHDKRIVVKKEKLADYSSVKFLGSNKKEVITYEITVRNNKKEKIRMLLKDQHPLSSTKDIEEELLESSGASVNNDTGILTWKIELNPGESKKYRVSYSVKYPKDRNINVN
jgi:hypothetical protein